MILWVSLYIYCGNNAYNSLCIIKLISKKSLPDTAHRHSRRAAAVNSHAVAQRTHWNHAKVRQPIEAAPMATKKRSAHGHAISRTSTEIVRQRTHQRHRVAPQVQATRHHRHRSRQQHRHRQRVDSVSACRCDKRMNCTALMMIQKTCKAPSPLLHNPQHNFFKQCGTTLRKIPILNSAHREHSIFKSENKFFR